MLMIFVERHRLTSEWLDRQRHRLQTKPLAMQRLNYDKAKPPLYERGVIRPGVDERFNHGALLFLPGCIVNHLNAPRRSIVQRLLTPPST
jgi:hypothetical protein